MKSGQTNRDIWGHKTTEGYQIRRDKQMGKQTGQTNGQTYKKVELEEYWPISVTARLPLRWNIPWDKLAKTKLLNNKEK